MTPSDGFAPGTHDVLLWPLLLAVGAFIGFGFGRLHGIRQATGRSRAGAALWREDSTRRDPSGRPLAARPLPGGHYALSLAELARMPADSPERRSFSEHLRQVARRPAGDPERRILADQGIVLPD